MVNVGLQIGSSIPSPCAIPCVKTVLPTPRSPTSVYTSPGCASLPNFDVYRIGDIEEMDEIGYEDYFYGEGLTMIEWANLIEEILPDHYREITIEKDLEKGFDYRKITILDR